MGILTYKGGIHPAEAKDLSKDKEIIALQPKGELVFLLAQHIGKAAKAIVEVGDYVQRGQKIAEADGFVSATIYSSVSGTVKAINELSINVQGAKSASIVIENDGAYKEVAFAKPKSLEELTKEEILERKFLKQFLIWEL